MSDTDTLSATGTRGLGLACAASGVLMVLLAIPIGLHIGHPSENQWSYPQSAGLFFVESVLLAVAHVASAAGFVGALRLGAQGGSRPGLTGLWTAVAGLVGLAGAEIASGFIGEKATDSTIATAVSAAFGLTSLVFAVGAIVGGLAILRAEVWQGSWKWIVLATGVVIIVLVTPGNISGSLLLRQAALLIWSSLFIPLGVEVARGLSKRPA
jgi:hypothetical protein